MESATTYWLTRFYFQRALGVIYSLGFLIALNQFSALCGPRGLLPVPLFFKNLKFWDAPSLFWINQSNLFITILASLGLGLSIMAAIGFSDAYGTTVSVLVWTTLWVIYSSFVNAGQTFYGFGWETLLLEAGFLAIFMGPSRSQPSAILIFLLRWLLFRLMFGAGLIKMRGDECWRDLTCLKYHYETMPSPGPTSWYFYYLPIGVQKASVLFNHFVELVVPFFYFASRPYRHTAGIITIIFQLLIISSGNFSWLNHVTLVIALACFDDSLFLKLGPQLNIWAKYFGVPDLASGALNIGRGIPSSVIYVLTAVIAWLSIAPVKNLISSRQMMNTSFEPLHLVNSYGAFGSITKERFEVILEGADNLKGPWKEYEFKAKPGAISRMPPLVAPYHYKLDWQMWFAAMSPYNYHPWIINLGAKILEGDKPVLNLLRLNPFPDHAPHYFRASLYEYKYTKPGDKNWWQRKYDSEYLPPLSLDDPHFQQVLQEQGWSEVNIKERSFDAVVVGSGPNGLSCAITLAQAGLSVAVIEKSETIGGGARTENLTLPGYVHDVCSAVHPLGIASPFFRSLPLEDFGLRWIYSPAEVAHPLDNGNVVLLQRSVEETAQRLGVDRNIYSHFFGPMTSDADELMSEILSPTIHVPKHFSKLTRFGLSALLPSKRFGQRFKGEEAKALWMGIAAHSAGSPSALASSAPGLALQVAGHGRGWPFPEGGSKNLTGALASYLKSKGGEIFTGHEVKNIEDLPQSRMVFFDLTPKQILTIAGNQLPAKIVNSFTKFRYGPGVFKLDWALDSPIPWRNPDSALAATVHLGGSFDEIIEWEESVSRGGVQGKPFVLLTQPSLFDAHRAPPGKHVAWAYCHVPANFSEDMTDIIESQVERFAPGFKKTILARSRLFPRDLERKNPNLIGGDISGGLVNARQLFFRPRLALNPYSLDGKRFWICSSSTPPGPGVHGMCGYNAALKALTTIAT